MSLRCCIYVAEKPMWGFEPGDVVAVVVTNGPEDPKPLHFHDPDGTALSVECFVAEIDAEDDAEQEKPRARKIREDLEPRVRGRYDKRGDGQPPGWRRGSRGMRLKRRE